MNDEVELDESDVADAGAVIDAAPVEPRFKAMLGMPDREAGRGYYVVVDQSIDDPAENVVDMVEYEIVTLSEVDEGEEHDPVELDAQAAAIEGQKLATLEAARRAGILNLGGTP